MAAMQGNGKIRLIAKKGRYAESDYSSAARSLALRGAISGGSYNNVMSTGGSLHEGDSTAAALANEGFGNYYIEFDVTPDITESGSASYFEAGEIRGPSSILMYMGSPSRTFSINAKLVARNAHEARKVAAQIHVLKSWRMPESYTGGINAGTPTLLYLQGYGKMFKDIPVVMTDLSIEFSSEHDYLTSGSAQLGSVETERYNETLLNLETGETRERQRTRVAGTYVKKYDSAVPIIVPISITLKEAHSTEGDLEALETFDILRYRTGNLVGW